MEALCARGVAIRTVDIHAKTESAFAFADDATEHNDGEEHQPLKLYKIDSRHVRVDPANGNWPATIGERWCDHCCHPFDGPPVPLPVGYDDRRDIFTVRGVFCGFSCAKTYNWNRRLSSSALNTEYLGLLYKRVTADSMARVKAAPPRNALKVFGGCMSIDEFRAASAKGIEACVLPPKMILHEQILEIRSQSQRPKPKATRVAQTITYGDLPRNETLRLRRPKPLQNKNVLDRMGFGVQKSVESAPGTHGIGPWPKGDG